MTDLLLILLFPVLLAALLTGYPVAFVLAGISLLFASIGHMLGAFDLNFLEALPNRIYGIMTNDLLIAVPLFVFMGTMLERTRIAEELLTHMARLFGNMRGGLGLSVILVGTLLAASTGIVGATVVTMGLISLPCMLKHRYHPEVATGIICASGTLGQIIPPSIVLILLGDQISSAYQTAQLRLGIYSPHTVSIADLFMGAIIPGLLLVGGYIALTLLISYLKPERIPLTHQDSERSDWKQTVMILLPPLALILVVLGSILSGLATATESAAVGAAGSLLLALYKGELKLEHLRATCITTSKVTCMVFTLLIGAAVFTLVFRGLGGDDAVHTLLTNLPGGMWMALLLTMLLIFVLGFFLDFIEITFVVVPIISPVLLTMGADPIWLAILIAVNLQTSFLTPPFGFALFYLRGVAPKEVLTSDIYRGIVPFVVVQLLVLMLLAFAPSLTTWLPKIVYGTDTSLPSAPPPPALDSSYGTGTIDW